MGIFVLRLLDDLNESCFVSKILYIGGVVAEVELPNKGMKSQYDVNVPFNT